jgi:malonate-semialdehyde dehydrogenase (acetylating)/methylmalonate-semialdehyde dehydrogenase
MPDADLDKGLPSLITSFYGCAGERCLSGSMLISVGKVHDELRDRFVAAAKAMKVGDGLDPATSMGPVISRSHRERVLGYIEKGIAEGAKLILDGRDIKVEGHPKGFFVGPTVFEKVTPDMTIAKEEIFGPVVAMLNVKNLDQAIEIINTRGFANAACLYTDSGKAVREFKYRVKPSMIGVNIGIAAPMAFFPFGGAGESLFGDLKGHGREVFQFFTDTKVVISRWL